MNITLIHPFINSSSPELYLNEPIGLLSLATFLRDNTKGEHNICILDLYALGYDRVVKNGRYYDIGVSQPDEIERLIRDRRPDIVGITCNFTTYAKSALMLADLVKERFPGVFVMLGGAHATMDAENILSKQCQADVVVRGEGELTFKELVERLKAGISYQDIEGITYRRGKEVISNPRRPLMEGIETLPIPDRSFIDQDSYSNINKKMYFLSKGKKVASIMTSRGCPYNCRFCSTKVVWERKFRPRPAAAVIAEMKGLIDGYGIDEFLINDDQFYKDKDRVSKICDMIAENGFRISFNVASGSSNWLLDEQLLKKLKRAGLYRITFPIETGSPASLRYIRKPIDLEKTKSMIKLANRLGIWTYANFIVGFPYETREDIWQTIDYAYKSGLDYATFFIAKPYAGSEMYDDFKNEGLLDEDIETPTTMGEVGHDIINMSAKELQDIRDLAQKGYMKAVLRNYTNPSFFLRFVFPKMNTGQNFRYFISAMKNTAVKFYGKPAIVAKEG